MTTELTPQLPPEEMEALKHYILTKFKEPFHFNAWLIVHIWPAFRERMDQNIAARRAAARLEREKKKDESPISTRFRALDGSPITEKQLERAAKKGEPLLEIATGQPKRFLWRIKGKVGRWVPLDYKGAF